MYSIHIMNYATKHTYKRLNAKMKSRKQRTLYKTYHVNVCRNIKDRQEYPSPKQ